MVEASFGIIFDIFTSMCKKISKIQLNITCRVGSDIVNVCNLIFSSNFNIIAYKS